MNKDFTLNGLDFSPEVNLVRYLQSIRKFPILSPEKEYALAVEYKKSHDPKIAQQLVDAHLRLVVRVVAKYKGYGLSWVVYDETNLELLKNNGVDCVLYHSHKFDKVFII